MSFLKIFLFCLLLNQAFVAGIHAQPVRDAKSDEETRHPAASSMFAATGSGVPYDVVTQSFPAFVPLSANRNFGCGAGDITLTSGGLKIREKGTYSVDFSVLLVNNDSIGPTPVFPIFLAINGELDIINPSNMCSTNIFTFGPVPYGFPVKLQGSGILNVSKRNTTITIFITNANGGAIPITVAEWNIDAFKINDCFKQ